MGRRRPRQGRHPRRQQLQQRNKGKPFLKPLKTRGSRRDLDLPADLIEALRAHRERQRVEAARGLAGWNAEELVFPSTAGTPMYARNLIRHYQGLLQSAGLPERPFHALRHTAATIMFARGMSEAEVQRVLGHSSIAITIDTYLHWIPTTPKRLASVMEGFRKSITPSTSPEGHQDGDNQRQRARSSESIRCIPKVLAAQFGLQ